jgi:hypothetical protein
VGSKLCLDEVRRFLAGLVEEEIDEDIEDGESEEWILKKIDVLVDVLNSRSVEEAVKHFTRLAWDLDAFLYAVKGFKGSKLCRQILIGVAVDHEDWWST